MYDDVKRYTYAVPPHVIQNLDLSIFAEQVYCSIVSETHVWSKLLGLAVWPTLERANQATSYYRNTAVGHMRRLLWYSECDATRLLTLVIAAMMEAKAYDKLAGQALMQLDKAESLDDDTLAAILKWHRRRKRALKNAALGLRAAVPREIWEEAIEIASPRESP